jgi:predicted signal transduction protein with EAL and GGDEF domain
VAEESETVAERDALRALGIDVVQGYYFARFVRITEDRFEARAA